MREELNVILENAPKWWGNDDKEIYDNLIFMMISLTYPEFINEIGNPKEEYEQVQHYKNAIFCSFVRKDYQKTNWWSKTANKKVKDNITIRTANTMRKIATM